MASQPSNNNLGWDHDPELLAVIIVFAILSVAAAVLCLTSRRMKKTKLKVEDYRFFPGGSFHIYSFIEDILVSVETLSSQAFARTG